MNNSNFKSIPIFDPMYTTSKVNINNSIYTARFLNAKCLLFNARSICNKLNEFHVVIKTIKPSLCAVTESWLNSNVSDQFLDIDNQYTIYKHNRESRGGGVFLMVANIIKSREVSINLDLPGVEIVCVDLVTPNELIRIVLCYRSTSLANVSLDLNFRLINCLKKLLSVKYKCLLMGDFNLPKIKWNFNVTINDAVHQAFYEYFCSAGLSQLNPFPSRNDATLDLVFSNDPGLVSDLTTLPPLGASDHDIISFVVRVPAQAPCISQVHPGVVRNYSKCNFNLLNTDLHNIDWNNTFIDCITADEHWSTFTSILDNLLNVYCPLFSINIRRNVGESFHYPPVINKLQAQKTRVWRRLRMNKQNDNIRAEYKAASDAYSEAIINFHRERESEVLGSRDTATFHKFIRRRLNRTQVIPTLLDNNNILIDDCDSKANLFNEFFSSVYTHDDGNLPSFPSRFSSTAPPLENIFLLLILFLLNYYVLKNLLH